MTLLSLFTDSSHAFAFYPLVALLGVSAYVLLVIAYRLTLHPLAKYPGPFLAKITDVYLAYHAWKGDRHLEFYRCHEKYGTRMRYKVSYVRLTMNRKLCPCG